MRTYYSLDLNNYDYYMNINLNDLNINVDDGVNLVRNELTDDFAVLYDHHLAASDEPKASTVRFSSADWFNLIQTKRIMVAGLGGIGSWTALLLSRLTPLSMTLVDDDIIDATNLGGQFFHKNNIGKSKVDVIAEKIHLYSDYYAVNSFKERIDANSEVPDIVFSGFDNMKARKDLYRVWKKHVECSSFPEDCLLIDGRLSAEFLQIFCMSGNDNYYMEKYEKEWLFDDSEAESEVCTLKQTSYCANLIASLIVNIFVNWCANKTNPLIRRSVPFMSEYSGKLMFLKTKE